MDYDFSGNSRSAAARREQGVRLPERNNMAELGFGCMRLPRIETEQGRIIDDRLFEQMVDRYLQSGFRYFDTAYKYCGGLSEPALRKALVERYPRDACLPSSLSGLAWTILTITCCTMLER